MKARIFILATQREQVRGSTSQMRQNVAEFAPIPRASEATAIRAGSLEQGAEGETLLSHDLPLGETAGSEVSTIADRRPAL
jgi:hypothetical protein